MSKTDKPPCDDLERLREELIADLLAASDKEILDEARADGIDPAASADRIRAMLRKAEMELGKERMRQAKAGAAAAAQSRGHTVSRIDPQHARKLLVKVAVNDPDLNERLTMAARNGEGLSDHDVLELLEDLRELGVISDEGEDA